MHSTRFASKKLKSLFTLIGVTIGVMFLIAVVSIVQGMSNYVENDFAGKLFGMNTFTLRRWNNYSDADNVDWREMQRRPRLFANDAALVRSALPQGSRSAITSEAFINATSQFNRPRQVQAIATEADYFTIKKFNVERGRAFGPHEVDPIGKQISVEGKQFTVIGVFHTKAGFLKTMDGRGPDKPRAILPMMTAYRHLDIWRNELLVMVKPRVSADPASVMDGVTELLRSRPGLKPGQPKNFALVAQDRMRDTFNQLFGAIFLVGLALSGVGLMVGGVGVVAIMMISVTERTREIGVGKALGATRVTILWQFLVEAATLTSIGAAVGLTIGSILAWVVRSYTPVPNSIPGSAIVVAVGASILTGVVFGTAPALRASRLDPIEALRHE